MNEYILFMHRDASDPAAAGDPELWAQYFTRLRGIGLFDGGSSIGEGECLRKGHTSVAAVAAISGFIRVREKNLEEAKAFLAGNPVFEAGGTVEVRELPRQ